MTRHSLPVLNYGLTINSWRHIQTIWKRKLRCSAQDLLDGDTEDTVDALQAGHSRATENHIYGLSVETLAGPAEDVLPLFLNASTMWQIKCKTVPGEVFLPYAQARSPNNSPPTSILDTYQNRGVVSNTSLASNADDIANKIIELLMPVLTTTIQAAISSTLTSLPTARPSPLSPPLPSHPSPPSLPSPPLPIRNSFPAHQ
ncbi:hypothetical protein DEU56DRAFT_755180 [Suillus clintonianus]|uniref:uncharacterized protein n=1 Tax=Suillus clintonianus TaxID=1904413 RepID=UPI001B865694|nr:uncharacterized protein DEU56DRAFT_755180 [Suillus clintonianus]KAG2140562.1 hypothetical protein DEU56DRAFT_755180 [Suillus clintonianus]